MRRLSGGEEKVRRYVEGEGSVTVMEPEGLMGRVKRGFPNGVAIVVSGVKKDLMVTEVIKRGVRDYENSRGF